MPLRGERLNVLLARSLREETSLAMRLTILSPIMERSIQVKALARSVFDMHDDPLAKMGAFRLTNNMNNAFTCFVFSCLLDTSIIKIYLANLFPLHSTREQKRTCHGKPAVMQIFGKTKLVQMFALDSQ